jgi:hypothetical protein
VQGAFISVLYILVYIVFRIWMMDKVQKPSNSVCYTPLSEPYRIYPKIIWLLRWERPTPLHQLGLVTGLKRPTVYTIHITISLQYHPNKSWNNYCDTSLCVMCQPTLNSSPCYCIKYPTSCTSCTKTPHVSFILE